MRCRSALSALAACLIVCGGVYGDLFIVDPGGGGYATINAALAAASDGDTIQVAAGTYDETLTIQKAITLSGEDKTNTILTYTGPPDVEQMIMLGANKGFDFPGDVVIENFTLYNGGGLDGDNDLIKLRARGVGGQIIIRDNIFDGDGDGSISSPATAIEECYYSSNVVITGNEFLNCGYGLWANSLQDSEITHNTFTECTGAIGMGGRGTGADCPQDLLILGNTMQDGTYGLVLARNIHDVAFSYNTITGNSFAGILYWEYGPENWSNVHFDHNNISGNADGFRGYGEPEGDPPPSSTVDATCNWWGDASGPSGDGSGSGDSVELDNVDFSSWLPEPASTERDPVADPGGPYWILNGQPCCLRGDGSCDPFPDDDDIQTWQWTIDGVAGPTEHTCVCTYSWAQLKALFGVPDYARDLPVMLTVVDGEGASGSAGTTLSIVPEPATIILLGGALAGFAVRRRRGTRASKRR